MCCCSIQYKLYTVYALYSTVLHFSLSFLIWATIALTSASWPTPLFLLLIYTVYILWCTFPMSLLICATIALTFAFGSTPSLYYCCSIRWCTFSI